MASRTSKNGCRSWRTGFNHRVLSPVASNPQAVSFLCTRPVTEITYFNLSVLSAPGMKTRFLIQGLECYTVRHGKVAFIMSSKEPLRLIRHFRSWAWVVLWRPRAMHRLRPPSSHYLVGGFGYRPRSFDHQPIWANTNDARFQRSIDEKAFLHSLSQTMVGQQKRTGKTKGFSFISLLVNFNFKWK